MFTGYFLVLTATKVTNVELFFNWKGAEMKFSPPECCLDLPLSWSIWMNGGFQLDLMFLESTRAAECAPNTMCSMMSAGRGVTLPALAFNLCLFSTVSRAFGFSKTERNNVNIDLSFLFVYPCLEILMQLFSVPHMETHISRWLSVVGCQPSSCRWLPSIADGHRAPSPRQYFWDSVFLRSVVLK
jgi:hypothetical protein